MSDLIRRIALATAPPLPQRPAATAPRADQLRWLWRRAQHGWPARYPLAQFPNAPLLLSLVASVVAGWLTGDARTYVHTASQLLLACWAWLELSAGVNLWRRAFGLAFLVIITANLGGQLT